MSADGLLNPTSVYASWPKPNYTDPERRTWMLAFALTWQITSTMLVGGRLYLRARKQAGSFGWDDSLISIGWLFSVGFTVTTLLDTELYNVDRHVWDVHPGRGVDAALDGWIGQFMFVLSTVPTKLSVLLFYRRMAKNSLTRRWMWAIYSALAITSGYAISNLIVFFLTCRPLESLWLTFDPTYTEASSCVDSTSFVIASGILSVVSDCFAVSIPFGILRKYNLDIPKRQRIALHITFAIGFLVTGAGIGRTYYIWRTTHSVDSSWEGFELLAWSVVECQLAIICACAPSCRVFFRHYLRDPLRRTFVSFSCVSHHPETSRRSGFRKLEEGAEKEIELEAGMCCRGEPPRRPGHRIPEVIRDGESEKNTTPLEYETCAKQTEKPVERDNANDRSRHDTRCCKGARQGG